MTPRKRKESKGERSTTTQTKKARDIRISAREKDTTASKTAQSTKKKPTANEKAAVENPAPSANGKAKTVGPKTSSRKGTAPKTGRTPARPELTVAPFPIVGIGASAGGLEALQAFFKATPEAPGMACVVVVHLNPNQVSLLPELLQKCTSLPVVPVTRKTPVRPNHIYVITPGHHLTIKSRVLRLKERDPSGAIDRFLRSLAEEYEGPTAAVILSGSGNDGTLGLRAIKGEGGAVFTQDESAQHDEMPQSAVATGLVDLILPPGKMPEQLRDYFDLTGQQCVPPTDDEPKGGRAYQKILLHLQAHTGHDFSQYKPNTIWRRIERRMAVHLISDPAEYAVHLREHEREAHTLFKDLLIGVTNFFRDPPAFHALRDAITELVRAKGSDEPFRVWVPGCSTGEEAYSISMLLRECMEAEGKHLPIQVFGTDLDEDAVEVARKGSYPSSIAADLTTERLEKYFVREDGSHYLIRKSIREMLVFAVQDVTKDPPFSRLDLLACRNLLIYLTPAVQTHLLSVFHYALQPKGLLFLGSSESTGTSELFDSLDRKFKLFRARPGTRTRSTVLELSRLTDGRAPTRNPTSQIVAESDRNSKSLFRAILQQSNAPPSVVVDQAMNVRYIHGRTGRFLEPPEGTTNVNVLDMARPGLNTALATCLRKAVHSRQTASHRNLTLQSNGEEVTLNLVVKPILEPEALAGMAVVFFETNEPIRHNVKSSDLHGRVTDADPDIVAGLKRQLVDTQESLQSTIEELETANEELKSTNEELQSTNEELLSSNEELQTSREELQSVNEESTTVNAELAARIEELARANDDLKNLLDSSGVATIFLDADFRIRLFTPAVRDLVPLTKIDAGRSLDHFSTALVGVNLVAMAAAVLDDLVIREKEIQAKDGTPLLLRVRPYRTAQNVIDGTVLTFDDRTEIKKAESLLQSQLADSRDALDTTKRQLERSQAGHPVTGEALRSAPKKETRQS